MNRQEQVRRIIDEWRTVSESHREELVWCLAFAGDVSARWRVAAVLDRIIEQRDDMQDVKQTVALRGEGE